MRVPTDPSPKAARASLRRALDAIPELRATRGLRLLSQANARAVFRGRLDGRDIVLKIGFTAWQEGRVTRQDAALRHFAASLAPSGPYRVPGPIGAWPAHRLSAADYIAAPRLDTVLERATPAERAHLLARAGGWLAAATAPHRRDDIFGGGYWVKRFSAETANLDTESHRRLAEALLAQLGKRAGPCAGLILARAPAHGDFRMRNLLHDAATDTTFAIDFDEWEVLPLARELATFLVDIDRHDPRRDPAADRRALLSLSGLPEAERETALPFFETRQVLHSVLNASRRGALPRSLAEQAERHLASC